jgi:hypothetical protein
MLGSSVTDQNLRLWDDMLDEFRALGGTADNVCLKEGPYGRGLFPRDPSKPVKVHIPESMLVKLDHIELKDGAVRVDPSAGVDSRVSQFVEEYQRNFAWGVARSTIQDLMQMVREAPAELRQLMDSPFNLDRWLAEPSEETIFNSFFASRGITYKDIHVVMPIIELANHGGATRYQCDDGIEISGKFDGEILAQYTHGDPLDVFAHWGFASPELFALSLHIGLDIEGGRLVIQRADVQLSPDRRPFYPEVSIQGDKITLSHMMLGHKNLPRLPRGILQKIMRNAGKPNADFVFDRIQHINRMQFLKLIEMSELAAGPLAQLLRRVARYQLEAMSHAIGTRDV